MNLEELILKEVAEIHLPGFFVTVDFSATGCEPPRHIEAFLKEKHESILRGSNGRKFVYKETGWRLIFTFFPTDRVVDERYAMKNKVWMKRK